MNSAITSLPVLILYPHSRCNCRCVMCDIWKESTSSEMAVADLERHLEDMERLAVRWVVLSGGEPLMHSEIFRVCSLLRNRGIRTTLLSSGLLLERNAERITRNVDDVIVSLDGPQEIHDRIRRVSRAFALLERGVQAIHNLDTKFPISGRCTVQKENHFCLCDTAVTAKQLGLTSISFLAADLTSEAFNRLPVWSSARQFQIALTAPEIRFLEDQITRLAAEWEGTGFVLESKEKLRRIVLHYQAHLGLTQPVAPKCNAPWVSAVVETDGTVRPCFFHRPIGSIKNSTLLDVLNSPEAVQFRSTLDVATNEVCRRCVCSMNWRR